MFNFKSGFKKELEPHEKMIKELKKLGHHMYGPSREEVISIIKSIAEDTKKCGVYDLIKWQDVDQFHTHNIRKLGDYDIGRFMVIGGLLKMGKTTEDKIIFRFCYADKLYGLEISFDPMPVKRKFTVENYYDIKII